MKFIIGQAEKHQVIEKPPPPPTGGVFTIPKGLPEEVEHEIYDYRPDFGEKEPMSRIYGILRRFINEQRKRSK